jgi:hypothetical protein
MEDKPEGQNQEQAGNGNAPQGPPPTPLAEKKEASSTGTDPDARNGTSSAQTPPKSRLERFKTWVWPMGFSDAVMLALTAAIAIGTVVSAAAIFLQWREMVKGGADTSALVGYAQRQADDADKIKLSADKQAIASQQFADNAALINLGVGDAVKRLDAQAKATQGSANAAKTAAETADKALHISERADITNGLPILNINAGFVTLPIINIGHIPSGKVSIVVHEVTIGIANPDASIPEKVIPSEAHWKHTDFESVPPTAGTETFSVVVPLPAMDATLMNDGHQQVFLVGSISYDDGFSNSAGEKPGYWNFCQAVALGRKTKQLEWHPCDWALYMTQAIPFDHYPRDEYQTQTPN